MKHKTSKQILSMLLALLNNGHWDQGNGYPVLGEVTGQTLSGTVTSFNSATDDITIALFAVGSQAADHTATVKGNTAYYAIDGVTEGTYTMRVSKPNHVTGEYTLVVGTNDLVRNVTIYPVGDLNLDGAVDVADTAKLYAHVKGTSILTEDVTKRCDMSGDGTVDIVDVAKLYAHVKGSSKLY